MKYLVKPKNGLLIVLFLAGPVFFLLWWGISSVEAPPQAHVIKNVPPTSHANEPLTVDSDSPDQKTYQSFTVRNPQGLPVALIPADHVEVGIGSGAFHVPTEEDNLIYVVTDNGPRHKCSKMSDKLRIAEAQLCPDDNKAQITFIPTIYHLSLNQDGTADLLESITLQGGTPIAGFDNLRRVEKGKNPSQVDQLQIEALVRLSDGTFWLASEESPSLLHVAADGQILKRIVPPTEMKRLAGASYPVDGSLPSVLSARRDNRGIEALGLSPDEQYLYFTTQAPLAHPDKKSSEQSRQLRIFKFDWSRNEVVGTFLYVLDAHTSFDAKEKQKAVRVSEIAAVGHDQLLLVEYASSKTRLYLVDLAQATPLDTLYGDVTIRPTLEESTLHNIYAQGIQALDKQLVAEIGMTTVPKIEGLAIINSKTLVFVNDTNYGKEQINKPITQFRLQEEIRPKP